MFRSSTDLSCARDVLKQITLIGSLILLLAGCSLIPIGGGENRTPTTTSISGSSENGDVANGELIYFRAVDQKGNEATYTGGPAFGQMMMGSYLTCASCHGPEARGGVHVMAGMQTMDAPAIYYDALVEMAKNDAGLNGYTLDNFREAVIDGLDVDGSTLDQNMPRWQMSDQDLGDLFAFLKTLHD